MACQHDVSVCDGVDVVHKRRVVGSFAIEANAKPGQLLVDEPTNDHGGQAVTPQLHSREEGNDSEKPCLRPAPRQYRVRTLHVTHAERANTTIFERLPSSHSHGTDPCLRVR